MVDYQWIKESNKLGKEIERKQRIRENIEFTAEMIGCAVLGVWAILVAITLVYQ